MPCLAVKKIEVRWALALAGSLGRVAELDMTVGSVTNRRSEREAGMEANLGQRDRRLY